MTKAKIELKDTWKLSGDNLNSFREIAMELDDHTNEIITSTAELSIMVVGYETSKYRKMMILGSDSVKNFENSQHVEPEQEFTLPKNDTSEDLLNESFSGAGFMIIHRNVPYYVSENALSSLFARAGVNGDGMFRISNARNIFLANCLYNAGIGEKSHGKHHKKSLKNPADQNCTLIVRDEVINGKKLRKIFFVPSEKYVRVPMTILADVAEEICDDDILGRPEVKYWFADHGILEIVITFPEKAEEIQKAYKLPHKIIPGVMLRSSDTGKSCVDVKSVAFIGKSRRYLEIESAKQKHMGNFEPKDILEEANDVILRNVKTLPELLAQLIGNPIYDGPEDEEWEKKNESACRKALLKCMKHTKIVPIIGKKREKLLKDALLAEIDPSIPYTEYDIALMIMTISDRIENVPQSMRDELAKAVATAPYAFKKKANEEELSLAPEA
jgi:hypothetical protein